MTGETNRNPIIGKVNIYTVNHHEDTPTALIGAYGFSLREAKHRGVYVVECELASGSTGQDRYLIRDAVDGQEVFSWLDGEFIDADQEVTRELRERIGNKSDLIVHNRNYGEFVRVLDEYDLEHKEFMPIKEGGRHFVRRGVL